MPESIGDEGLDGWGEIECFADCAEGMAGKRWPSGARELEGIDPWAESVCGEGAEEAFFCAVAVCDYGAVG